MMILYMKRILNMKLKWGYKETEDRNVFDSV